jgi:hypothetical protein
MTSFLRQVLSEPLPSSQFHLPFISCIFVVQTTRNQATLQRLF